MRKIDYVKYFDKVYGCLLGKTVIGTLGAPFEGVKMPLELEFSPKMINTMLPNDDLDLQVLWLDELEKHGETFTSYDLQKRFAESCPYDPGEYAIMRKNYKRGVYAPLSGKFSNYFYIEGMGCPIRSEVWACVSPLDIDRAVDFAARDGVLDHFGESVYAEKFFVALEAEAFFESDMRRLIELGLKRVPENCRFRELVGDTLALCDKYDDEKLILRKILFKYGHPDCTNMFQNIAITLIALLKGEGDMIKTGMMALNCGFDTDCTCATAGAVLGIIMGADEIIKKYGWNDITYVLGVECERRSDKVIDLAEDMALIGAHLGGGLIENAPHKKFDFAPSQYPLKFDVLYDNDDPTFSPEHSCGFTLCVSNLSGERVETELMMNGAYMNEKISLAIAPKATTKHHFEAKMPENIERVSETNRVLISYEFAGESREFVFGIVGVTPWKAIGPIWRTDPICNTELLIAADLKYKNIIRAVEYDGHRTDVTRRFHLNFAPDTETEYMSVDACFTPYDAEDISTKYEESVFYQREDIIRFGDICGLKGPAVVYLARELVCSEDRTVFVQVGHSSPFTLWINGEKVAQRDVCDTFDAENVHLEGIKLNAGVNRILFRLTQINDDAKYSLVFSKSITCGEHYTDFINVLPEKFV